MTHSPAVGTPGPRVVTAGPLMPDLVAALQERYAACPLEDLGAVGLVIDVKRRLSAAGRFVRRGDRARPDGGS